MTTKGTTYLLASAKWHHLANMMDQCVAAVMRPVATITVTIYYCDHHHHDQKCTA